MKTATSTNGAERTFPWADVPSTEQTFFWEQLRQRLCSRLRVPTSRLINRRSGTEYCVLRERLWRTCWLERREETSGVKISGLTSNTRTSNRCMPPPVVTLPRKRPLPQEGVMQKALCLPFLPLPPPPDGLGRRRKEGELRSEEFKPSMLEIYTAALKAAQWGKWGRGCC